jgi:uncharacterized protein (DUF2235 family)
MRHWEPGDRIYLVGSSRGAYTVRALAGMLATVGILRRGSENLVPYAIAVFSREVDGSQAVPIVFLGLYTRKLRTAGSVRHAVAIDEKRRPYGSATYHHRQVPHHAQVHESVRAQMTRDQAYAPTLPADVVWVDPSWWSPGGSQPPERHGTEWN